MRLIIFLKITCVANKLMIRENYTDFWDKTTKEILRFCWFLDDMRQEKHCISAKNMMGKICIKNCKWKY